jgi:hypothetical protein
VQVYLLLRERDAAAAQVVKDGLAIRLGPQA